MLRRRHALGAIAVTWAAVNVATVSACGGRASLDVGSDDAGALAEASATGASGCVPGQQSACACPGGALGVQVCADDGRRYGACQGCGGSVEDAPEAPTDAAKTDAALIDGGPDAACTTVTIGTNRQAVSMLFLLDGSGSMNQDNKWVAATGALRSIFDDMATKDDPGVLAGLIVFSDSNDPTAGMGPYPSAADVTIAPVDATHATALKNRCSGAPSGGTPTGTALQGAYADIEGFTKAGAGAKKVVVLMTDGVPTDQCTVASPGTGYATNACMTLASAELAKAGPAGPIETFALGVGLYPSSDFTNFDPMFLGNLAVAGGSAPAGCDPGANTASASLCYFEVDPSGSASATQTAFEAAINTIRGQVISCTFSFTDGGADGGAIDPTKINVALNGALVTPGPVDGWTFDDPNAPSAITLHGSACTTAKTTPNATVEILLGCPTKS